MTIQAQPNFTGSYKKSIPFGVRDRSGITEKSKHNHRSGEKDDSKIVCVERYWMLFRILLLFGNECHVTLRSIGWHIKAFRVTETEHLAFGDFYSMNSSP